MTWKRHATYATTCEYFYNICMLCFIVFAESTTETEVFKP
jgi:hypothetical protein